MDTFEARRFNFFLMFRNFDRLCGVGIGGGLKFETDAVKNTFGSDVTKQNSVGGGSFVDNEGEIMWGCLGKL